MNTWFDCKGSKNYAQITEEICLKKQKNNKCPKNCPLHLGNIWGQREKGAKWTQKNKLK